MKKKGHVHPFIYIVPSALLMLLLSSCTVREELGREIHPGQAFTAGERQARRSGQKVRRTESGRSKRRRLDGRAEYRNEQIIPSRLDYFQGNPHLSR